MKRPIGVVVSILVALSTSSSASTIFTEGFEDLDLAARGWYDNLNQALSTTEHLPGSTSSIEFYFPLGASTPATGGGMRIQFAPTPSVYLRYYVEYSASWTGSDRPYHPHQFHFLTDVDHRWIGPAYTHLTLYIEQNEGVPLLAIQDSMNIDESNVGVDLTSVTELRSCAGCNGDSDGHGVGDCYLAGSTHRNGKGWRAGRVYFDDAPGPYYKGDWHLVEALFVLNSVSAGLGVADGRVAYWYDGQPVFDHRDVMLRTGQWPDMQFDQFLIAPYIGDGSPVDQTMWVDDLTVATARVMTLLRDDSITSTATRSDLAAIFDGVGVSSLPDVHRLDFVSGAVDDDPMPPLNDTTRPLMFYQIDAAIPTLRLVKTGATIAIAY